MPFIDFHKFEGITVEDLKNAHIADLAAQDKCAPTYSSSRSVAFFEHCSLYDSEGGSHDQILTVIEHLSKVPSTIRTPRTSYLVFRTYSTTTPLKKKLNGVSSLN